MFDYKNNLTNILAELERQGFLRTVDSINEYSDNADLYYRGIGGKRYLVFNHYNKNRKSDLQGFDCWISTYNSNTEIGNKKAIQVECVQTGVQFERDWHKVIELLKK